VRKFAPEIVVPGWDSWFNEKESNMDEILWIRSHVERLLQAEWDICTIATDDDGDYPFRYGSAAGWVRVMASEPVMVRILAAAATGLRPSLKLMSELNDIGGRALSANIRLERGTVS
jgi:hypothetical protein